jgi:Xaa-Pro aminopeptidase
MIFGRHSVLKRGCSTWNKEQMPEEEFHARLAAVRREMDVDALVVYGDNYSFADLCYLTNYFPKVRGGLALVPRNGAVSLLLNIGSRDVAFAKTLTWVEDVRASNQVGADAAKLLKEKAFDKAKIGLADSGRGFPLPQLEEMKGALPGVEWRACNAVVEQMRLKKSGRELSALRAAGKLLHEISESARGFVKTGRKEYEVIADIDRLARDKGVEDIRILVGEKRLQPPSFKQTAKIGAHWTVYLAVQHERYWAESGRTYVLADHAKIGAAYEKAQDVLAEMARALKPGAATAALADTARKQLGEFYGTASIYGLGNGVGLSQWEAPFLGEDDARQIGASSAGTTRFDENMTVALRAIFESEGKLILFGDTFEVTSHGPRSLVQE